MKNRLVKLEDACRNAAKTLWWARDVLGHEVAAVWCVEAAEECEAAINLPQGQATIAGDANDH